MSNKDIEHWLLTQHFFVDCIKCVNREEDCYKGCKFYQKYKESRQ